MLQQTQVITVITYFNRWLKDLSNINAVVIGREVCILKNPSSAVCPVQRYCAVFVNNVVDKHPPKIKRPKKPYYWVAAGIIWNNDKLLIIRRAIC